MIQIAGGLVVLDGGGQHPAVAAAEVRGVPHLLRVVSLDKWEGWS